VSWEHKEDLQSLSNSIAREHPKQALKHIIMTSNSKVNLQRGVSTKYLAHLQVSRLTTSSRIRGHGNGRSGGCEGGKTSVP
jgi:hypothetical protein